MMRRHGEWKKDKQLKFDSDSSRDFHDILQEMDPEFIIHLRPMKRLPFPSAQYFRKVHLNDVSAGWNSFPSRRRVFVLREDGSVVVHVSQIHPDGRVSKYGVVGSSSSPFRLRDDDETPSRFRLKVQFRGRSDGDDAGRRVDFENALFVPGSKTVQDVVVVGSGARRRAHLMI